MKVAEIKRKSTTGVIAYTLRTGLLYVIAILATGLLSAFLSPEEFGIYFVVTAVVGIFTFLSDIGLAAALIQKKIEPTLEELRSTFTVQQMLALLIFGLTIALTPVWKQYSNLDEQGLELLYALGFSFVLASLKTIPSILLERQLQFEKLVIPQFVENIVFYSLAVVLAWKGFGVRSYTIAVLCRSVMGVIIIYLLKRWPIGLALSKTALRTLLGFGFKFQINDLLARLKDDLYIVILSSILPTAQMGYIGWAKRWSMFPYQFTVNSVVAITFPTYSRLQEEVKLLSRAIEKSIFFITLLIFPILAGIIMIAGPFTDLVPEYRKWQPALPALYLFCVNIAWAAISSPLTNTLNAIGKIDITLRLMVMWTLLTWGLTPLGLYFFGMTGVAVVSALVGISSVMTVIYAKRYIPLAFGEQVWRQLLATGAMMLGLLWLRQVIEINWVSFVGLVVAGGVVYTSVMGLTGFSKIRAELRSLLIRKQ